jgi:hypothetical protein
MNKTDIKNMITEEFKSIVKEARDFVIIDPRGNARPVGAKSQGNQFLKKMGGARKGWFMVLKKNALKARRAIEKVGGRTSDSKLQDTMFDLLYEGKLNEGKLPKRFTVKKKFRVQGMVFNTGDYAKKKERMGKTMVLNMDNNEILSIDYQDYIAAVKNGLIKESKLNEGSKTAKQLGLSDKFSDALDVLPGKKFTKRNILKLAKSTKDNPKAAIAYAKDAFNWLYKEDKLNERNFVDDFLFNNKGNVNFYNAVEKLKAKDMNKRYLLKLAKKFDVDPKDALRFVKEMWITKLESVREGKLIDEGELNENIITEGYETWLVRFANMNLSGVELRAKKEYRVTARTTIEAIKKASKMAGLKGKDWMATVTDSIKKL